MPQKRLNTPEKRARIGERIKLAATQAGLTLKDLAEATQVKPTLIYQYVRGITIIPDDLLEKIAAVTRVHTDFFDPDADARTTFALPSDLPAPAGAAAPRIPEPATQERLRVEFRHLFELSLAHNTPKRNRTAYIASLEQMLGVARASDNRQKEAWTLFQLGSAYAEGNHFDEAFRYFEQARELYQREDNAENSLHVALSLARLQSESGRFDEARATLKDVVHSPNAELRWRGLISLGSLSFRQNSYAEALDYFRQAAEELETAEGLEREEGVMELRNHIADVVRATGHYEEAMRLWAECLQQATAERKADAFLESLMEIAQCCHLLGQISEAKQKLEVAVVLASLVFEDEARTGIARALLADVLTAMGALDEARDNARLAMQITAKSGGPRYTIVATLAFAETKLASGQWQEALTYTKDALNDARRTRRTREEALTHELRARAHLFHAEDALRAGDTEREQDAWSKALTEAQQSLMQAEQADAIKELIAAHLTMARCHLFKGQEAEAQQHLQEAQQLNDSGAVGLNRLLGSDAESLPQILRNNEMNLSSLFAGRRVSLPALEWQTFYLTGTLLARQHGDHAAFSAMRDAAQSVGRIMESLSSGDKARFVRRYPEIGQLFHTLQKSALSDMEKLEASRLAAMAQWGFPVNAAVPALTS